MTVRQGGNHSGSGFGKALGAARGGDRYQLGVLLDVYRDYLLFVATKDLPKNISAKVGASDIVQETLLQASQAFDEFRGSTEFELRAWLKQILSRKLVDVHRYFRDYAKRDVSREVAISDDCELAGSLSATMVVEEVFTSSSGKIERLENAFRRLNEDERTSIELHTFEQFTFKEVGEKLGRSPEAARKLWARAIQKLTQELRSDESGPL